MFRIINKSGISLYTDDTGSKLKVTIDKKLVSCTYACYFYIDESIKKHHYQSSNIFEVNTNLLKAKEVKVRFYVFDKKINKKISKSIDITNLLPYFRLYSSFLINDENDYLLDKSIKTYVNNSENIKRGKRLFENRMIKLTRFSEVEWVSWENWEVNPVNNRSWQWALHWFDFIKYLLAFHHVIKNEKILDELKEAIGGWISRYLYNNTDFEFIWHDHATALRAEQILLFLYYLKKYSPTWMHANLDFVFSLFETLSVLGKKLAQEGFYSKHTNHGLEQVRVLILLGIILDNKEYVEISILRLNGELDFSFTSEGVHKENSPGYHQFVFKIFLSIIENFPSYVLKDLGPKFNDIASKALTYITYILRPDNNLPIIGDTELKPTSDAYSNYFSGTIEYENFLYSLSQGARGTLPSKNNIVYPKSGYAIFRDTWGNKEKFTDSMHLIFKAGCLSQYHHQQDENNFVLYAFGEDWIIDSGLYNYINQDPIRHYIRRRQAHNIPIISNTSYNYTDFHHRVGSWSIYDYNEDNLSPYVSARNTALDSILHSRTIRCIYANNEIIIEDNVSCLDHTSRTVTFLMHIPIDKRIDIFEDTIKISSHKTGKAMIISLSEKPNLLQVRKGLSGNKVHSIVSYTSGSYKESQVIRLTFESINEINLKMCILFTHT